MPDPTQTPQRRCDTCAHTRKKDDTHPCRTCDSGSAWVLAAMPPRPYSPSAVSAWEAAAARHPEMPKADEESRMSDPTQTPALPEPYATRVTWRDPEGDSWSQWHDADDPMPQEQECGPLGADDPMPLWEYGPPDIVVHVYSADQVAEIVRQAVVAERAAHQDAQNRLERLAQKLAAAEYIIGAFERGADPQDYGRDIAEFRA